MTFKPSLSKHNTRLELADSLRGLAIGGITIWHFIQHMNFWNFPQFSALDCITYDISYFLFCGKMYAIFALLFGLSMFIQVDNQKQQGIDFRLRFCWRMCILMIFGLFDLCFYNGDILFVYAVCGLLIIPFVMLRNRFIGIASIIFLIQPIEFISLITGIINPYYQPLNLNLDYYFGELFKVQETGGFIDVALAGIKNGLQINFFYAIESGRLTQTIGLFLLGVIIGRKRLLYNESNNIFIWKRIIIFTFITFFFFNIISPLILSHIARTSILYPLTTILKSWENLAFILFLIFTLNYFFHRKQACKNALFYITPYGRMSLTNYILQSIIGGFLFYNWGLGLFKTCGHFESMLLGLLVVIVQFAFSKWYLKSHSKGPLENIWHKLTWI